MTFQPEVVGVLAGFLLLVQVLAWKWIAVFRARSLRPTATKVTARLLLAIWGLFSPWLDYMHFLRISFGSKSQLRVPPLDGSRIIQIQTTFLERLRSASAHEPVSARIVLIHGTWATEDFNKRWGEMIATMSKTYPNAEIWGLHWLGLNSVVTRVVSAMAAVRHLRLKFGTRSATPLILVGFSHGGSLAVEIMRHPFSPSTWKAIIVGMPLLTADSATEPEWHQLRGGRLLWHPDNRRFELDWSLLPAVYFVLVFQFANILPPLAVTLSWILALLLAIRFLSQQTLGRQISQNSRYVRRVRTRHRERLLRLEHLSDSSYMGHRLMNLQRPEYRKRVQNACVFVQAIGDEVSWFTNAVSDVSAARVKLAQIPLERHEASSAITRHLDSRFVGLERWTWPGLGAAYLRDFEWRGNWDLYRHVEATATKNPLSRVFFAPRGGLYVCAGGIAACLFWLLERLFQVAGGSGWGPPVALVISTSFVAFHPWVVKLQRLQGQLHGASGIQDMLLSALETHSRGRNSAYDSFSLAPKWISVAELGVRSRGVEVTPRIANSLTLDRHRASLGDPSLVALVVTEFGQLLRRATEHGASAAHAN